MSSLREFLVTFCSFAGMRDEDGDFLGKRIPDSSYGTRLPGMGRYYRIGNAASTRNTECNVEPHMILSGKTTIITGAAMGLGFGIAQVCHREGANVMLADLDDGRVREAAQVIGDRVESVRCDVRVLGDLSRLVNQTVERFGRIDGLVNNAGVNFVKPF